MRVFVFLLLVANLAFYAWANGHLGSRAHPDAVRLAMQISPERLQILSRDKPPAEQAKKPPDPLACSRWSGLGEETAEQLAGLFAARFADLAITRSSTPGSSTWWVFIPALASKADAERKAGELRRLGVTEYYIVLDDNANRNAVSLGLFSSEEAAQRHLEHLRSKGVRSARHEVKSSRPATFALEARGRNSVLQTLPEVLRADMPELAAGTACAPAD